MPLEEKNQAALDLFKHYSNIRFLMLPLYFTAMGAIIFAYWTVSIRVPPDPAIQLVIALAGLLVAVIFTVYEYYLSKTLLNVSTLLPASMNALKHTELLGPVTCLTMLLYFGPAIFWCWRVYVHS